MTPEPIPTGRRGEAGLRAVGGEREIRRGRRRVLLVEDDEDMRLVLEAALQRCGFTVASVGNGVEALQTWHRCRGAFGLVVTDGDMPLMGGAELVRRLHRLSPGLKVLYISANHPGCSRSAIPPQADVEFLPKPFGAAVFCERVGARLGPCPACGVGG